MPRNRVIPAEQAVKTATTGALVDTLERVNRLEGVLRRIAASVGVLSAEELGAIARKALDGIPDDPTDFWHESARLDALEKLVRDQGGIVLHYDAPGNPWPNFGGLGLRAHGSLRAACDRMLEAAQREVIARSAADPSGVDAATASLKALHEGARRAGVRIGRR